MPSPRRGSAQPSTPGTGSGEPATLSARQAAVRALADQGRGRRTARDVLDGLVGQRRLSDVELGLATELALGVLRHRLTLARVLDRCAARGWKCVSRQLRDILLLGAYQVIWLDGIPPFAAVSEAVELAKAAGGSRAGRFVNAVLRQLLRDVEHRRIPSDQADPARAVPVDLQQCCQFRRPVLPDPSLKPVEHLADATSHPVWLVSRWVDAFGFDRALEICQAGLCRPPMVVRPNGLRTDAAALVARLQQEGFSAHSLSQNSEDRAAGSRSHTGLGTGSYPLPPGDAVAVDRAAALTRSAAFTEGWFQPQDQTAMEVVRQMALTAGQCVIDLCAGPGTKTTQMAEIMTNRGTILACDKDAARLDMLRANCERLGVSIVRTVGAGDIEAAAAALPRLDWILVDAPCSNTGVLARRPEARYRVSPRSIEALASIQRGLLEAAVGLSRRETRLLYSTCSIDPAENEEITRHFARAYPDWQLVASQRTLPCPPCPEGGPAGPGPWRDGGYWAIWGRA